MSDQPAEQVHHDDTDVEACLARQTHDGPGDIEAIHPPTFEGFPEEDVEHDAEETDK